MSLRSVFAFGLLCLVGCASTGERESPSAIAEPRPLPAPAPETKAPSVAAPSRGTRKEKMERAAERAAERTTERGSEKAAERAPTDAILFECIVRLPDDPTENRELCRSFRMTIEDAEGGEVARFRFGLDGSYRFAGKASAKYRLKTSTGKNWLVSIEPSRDLVLGDRVRVELKQKE